MTDPDDIANGYRKPEKGGDNVGKYIKLKPFKLKYDKQVKMWVAQDVNTGYASQGESKEKATENLIEALRLVILTYQDIKK